MLSLSGFITLYRSRHRNNYFETNAVFETVKLADVITLALLGRREISEDTKDRTGRSSTRAEPEAPVSRHTGR